MEVPLRFFHDRGTMSRSSLRPNDPVLASKGVHVTRRIVISAYLSAFAFVMAHTVNAYMIDWLTVPAEAAAANPGSTPVTLLTQNHAEFVDEILEAGLFPIPTKPSPFAPLTSAGTQPAPATAPIAAAKKIKLSGTVVGDGYGGLAIVQILSTGRQSLYRPHDQVLDLGEIADIRKNGMVLQRGAQKEFLELALPKSAQQNLSGPLDEDGNPMLAQTASAPGDTHSGPQRIVLDRREVLQSTADLPKLLASARALPLYNTTTGKLDGWRLEMFRSESLFGKMGLLVNDVLQRVNGVEIRDPSVMLAMFQQAKDERTINLDLVRGGQKTTMTYEIR